MTLLYAAFAVVALWLLGELLLQRRAPLHWRALALVGFLVLVAGVVQGSLPLIGAGVVAFGAGQVLATRAVKQHTGVPHWSLVAPERVPVVGRLFTGEEQAPAPVGRPSAGRPRSVRPEPVAVAEPGSEPVVAAEAAEAVAAAGEATAVFQAAEYSGEYPAEGDSVYYGQSEQEQQQAASYAYQAEQQVSYADPYADPYAQQYQEQYAQQYQQQYQEQYAQQYQEYAQYQQYPEYQQQYAGYEQQGYAEQTYAQQAYGTYEQPQAGYDYQQAPYYAADPQQQPAPQG